MSKKKKLQDNDWLYNLLRYFVDFNLKRSYRSIKYTGLERIPSDGAVIFAPNHTGALMDALVILAMNKRPKVFIARADIFKNPKLAKLFRFFKMMPIMRMRDGMEEVKKNNKTIEIAADVLKDNVPLCMFPEGTHQTRYSMLPLSKGIFRIALQAKELLGETPLYIVPVGIRYGSFYRFRSTARIQIGNPLNVGEFIAQNEEKTPQEQMNIMKKLLEERMRENILYIPNDENYDAINEICATVSKIELDKQEGGTEDQSPLTVVNKKAVEHIGKLRIEKPELASRLVELGKEAAMMRIANKISLKSVAMDNSLLYQIFRILLLIVTLPYTALAALCTLPLSIVCGTLLRNFKDRAFHNSVRYVINLILWPLLFIIYAIVAFACLPSYWAIWLAVAIMPAPAVTQDTFRAVRMAISDYKLWHCKQLKKKYNEIKNLFFK